MEITSYGLSSLYVPKDLHDYVHQLFSWTDRFCTELLDDEYVQLCRRAAVRLARKQPFPLTRGQLWNWMRGIIYATGSINFLFDRNIEPNCPGRRSRT